MRHTYRFLAIGILVCALAVGYNYWATRVNPYSAHTWVTPFFTTQVEQNGTIDITKVRDVQITHLPLSSVILYADIVREAVLRLFTHDPDAPIAGDANTIIATLHTERFDPSRAYVITGGHFPDLYVRNLGIFYAALLDPRIPSSEDDWHNRERITLQTLATHLELLKQAGKEYTTFAPISSNAFAAVNWNDEPSDSLFAIVYTLNAARDPSFISNRLPTGCTNVGKDALQCVSTGTQTHTLDTQQAANTLLQNYQPTVEKELTRYGVLVMDQSTGLIKKDVALSGARDNIRQTSGFYDNIIAYATMKDAATLNLAFPCPSLYQLPKQACDFALWKKNIITAFWRDESTTSGLFIDDLSASSLKSNTYTGEEFLALQIGFLDIHNADDRERLLKMVSYVKAHHLDKPFPLLYAAADDRSKASNFFVGFSSYAGKSIWSHLGQAYIQTLVELSPGHPELLGDAKTYLATYQQSITRYGGYPELYNADGTLFTAPISKAVLHVGWVIGYEQAQMLYGSYINKTP